MRIDLKKIIDLRHTLHKHAELSSKEFKTSEIIENFISKYKPDQILKIADTGLAFIFEGKYRGKTIVFRSELDALPIDEPDNIEYHSINKGVSHKCGHDGHMAILASLAQVISKERPLFGKFVLLFQPAEENLNGALKVLDDPNFKKLDPDFIFAIHNLPNFKENIIILREGNYTSATSGLTINLIGNTSHAANPELANNPTDATIELLNFVRNQLLSPKPKKFKLVTPVYTQIGTPDFGITPGTSQLKFTLRANEQKEIDELSSKIINKTKQIAAKHNLELNYLSSDNAIPVYNNQYAIELLTEIAIENKYQVLALDEPFKWTEDFGYFTKKFRGAFVCIGAGESHDLHDKNYDFNDNIIKFSTEFLYKIYKKFAYDNK